MSLPAGGQQKPRRDHQNRTKDDKSGAGPTSSIPVVKVISVVTPAAELLRKQLLRECSVRSWELARRTSCSDTRRSVDVATTHAAVISGCPPGGPVGVV